MIHTGTLLRAELYNDYTGKSSVVTVYNANKGKHPGKLIVTNGHWWDPGPKLRGNYKVDGKIISRQYDPRSTSYGVATGAPSAPICCCGSRTRAAQAETTRTSIQMNGMELVILSIPA